MVTKSGVYEQYHPLTGEGFGAVGLGMSSLVVDWIYRLELAHHRDFPRISAAAASANRSR